MNFKKEDFVCKKCTEKHQLITLLEFPLPSNISDVSSGKVEGNLRVVSKNMYALDRELYILSSLIIPINNFYDHLEIQNWVRIKWSEWRRIREDIKEHGELKGYEVIVEGIMVYPIPHYGMSNFPIVKLAMGSNDFLPRVELAISTDRLYQDWKNGIELTDLHEILSFLYHV